MVLVLVKVIVIAIAVAAAAAAAAAATAAAAAAAAAAAVTAVADLKHFTLSIDQVCCLFLPAFAMASNFFKLMHTYPNILKRIVPSNDNARQPLVLRQLDEAVKLAQKLTPHWAVAK